jgi:hypothetical protein
MSKWPSVYLIDDESGAIDLFNVLKQIVGFEDAVSMSLQDTFQTKSKTVNEVARSCVDKMISTSGLQCVVFLDLNLELGEKIDSGARTKLRTTFNLGRYAQDAPDYYQGLAVANRIIELLPKNFPKRLLFMLQTRGEEVPLPKTPNPMIHFGQVPSLLRSFGHFAANNTTALDAIKKMSWLEIKSETVRRKVVSFGNVDGFFKGLDNSAGWWMRKWLLHEDVRIADLLNDYLNPFREGIGDAWTHNWAQQEEGLLAGSRVLGTTPDPESNKALFMRRSQEIVFHQEVVSRDVDPALLQRILERLDIQYEMIGIDGHFKLPAMPGIAFLLGLKVLLHELVAEGSATDVEFRHTASSYSAQIRLRDDPKDDSATNEGAHGCVKRFLEKMRSSSTGQPNDGVSGAIWDLAHCRVGGLQNPENEPCVTMLQNGQPFLAAWPSFLKTGIEFRW